jgi:hypothetical protein
MTLGNRLEMRSILVKFLVVDCPSAYNAIIKRPTLNVLEAIVSKIHLVMKFPSDNDEVVTIKGKSKDAKLCYLESLKVGKGPIPKGVKVD